MIVEFKLNTTENTEDLKLFKKIAVAICGEEEKSIVAPVEEKKKASKKVVADSPAKPVEEKKEIAPVVQETSAPIVPDAVLPTAEAEKYSFEQIARAMVILRDTKGVDELKAILVHFNANALTAIPEDRYNELVTILNEKGVKV